MSYLMVNISYLECQPGFYGNNCLSVCGKCRNGMPCNSLDGSCPVSSGCEMGWTGPTCQTSKSIILKLFFQPTMI